ncbi:MAG TPA: hypothetical protein VNH17_11790 [Streptosporangiaceae bacterium]|nr:hypothetical protein [Streptosporangiaceae bacterium]
MAASTEGGDWRPVPDPTLLTTAQLLRELGALRELIEARLNGMDRATALLSETVNRTPTVIQTEISHVRELIDERFGGIDKQFAERDVRTEQAAKASKEALDAALLSAKELVSQQNDSNTTKAEKTEQNFTKQIDNALDRISEIKERLDRGEGSTSGAAGIRTDQRLNLSTVIAAVATLVAVLSFILYALKK